MYIRLDCTYCVCTCTSARRQHRKYISTLLLLWRSAMSPTLLCVPRSTKTLFQHDLKSIDARPCPLLPLLIVDSPVLFIRSVSSSSATPPPKSSLPATLPEDGSLSPPLRRSRTFCLRRTPSFGGPYSDVEQNQQYLSPAWIFHGSHLPRS